MHFLSFSFFFFFFFQAEDGIRDAQESRGLGDVYKRQYQRRVRGNELEAMGSESVQLKLNKAKELVTQLRSLGKHTEAMALEKMLGMTTAAISKNEEDLKTEIQPKPEIQDHPAPCAEAQEDPAIANRRKQVAEARALVVMLRENGNHEKADEVEGLLAQMPALPPLKPTNSSLNEAATASEQPSPAQQRKPTLAPMEGIESLIQEKREREQDLQRALGMVNKLKEVGRTREAVELIQVVTDLAESSSKDMDEAHTVDNLEMICDKISTQTHMIGEYVGTLEESIPQDSSELKAWTDILEMCDFLDMYVRMLGQQKALATDYVGLLQDEEAKLGYIKKLVDADEVLKSAQCISLQLQNLAVNVQMKEMRSQEQPEAANN
eukprot:TRINITY_DN15418_c0_g1_i12.p1 TRINITY_DN15418_c0_g1~~TRINITY_DN15418_c0_g1_i12.p1  ORF type:complete len:379 (+),score=144.84 TRINITY_DN15418_c0_g1_i12:110-1246(+)